MILVVGATGLLGGQITRLLLAQGRSVRILVRPNSPSEALAAQGRATSAHALMEAGAQAVEGDLKDPASLTAACKGIDVVITTANSAGRGGDDNPQTVDLEGNRSLIDAAKAAGVERFIFISTNLADPDSPVPFIAAKGKTEQHLQASGMPYTIVSATPFMNVWIALVVGGPALAGQPVHVVGSGARQHAFVAQDDVARLVVAALDRPEAANRQLTLSGPAALSFRDAASLYGQVLGREIPVVSVAPGEPVPGLPEAVWGLAAGFDQFDSPADVATARAFGLTPTPLEQFIQTQVGA